MMASPCSSTSIVAAEELHAQAADEDRFQASSDISLPVGIEPGNFRCLGALDRLAVEEAAAVKHRLLVEEAR